MTDVASALRTLTGSHTRVVWVQQQEHWQDFYGISNDFKLMGLDSEDGIGERCILAPTDAYGAPMVTPNGDRIIYSHSGDLSVHIVSWDGTGHRVLGPGFASAVWRDSASGIEWVYVRPETCPAWNSKSRPMVRHQIDNYDVFEEVYTERSVSRNWFQLSRDGRKVALSAPWPQCGMADLPGGTFKEIDKGCWTGMAPDNSYRMWVFDIDHRHVRMYDQHGTSLGRVDVHNIPGIDDWEVYHPRWSNSLRFLSVTGPFSQERTGMCPPEEKTKIYVQDGGRNVDLYVGRFNDSLSAVEEWVRITRNEKADFYGDVWVKPVTP